MVEERATFANIAGAVKEHDTGASRRAWFRLLDA
jgi:hypothetical protein